MAEKSQLWNIPNRVSLARLALAPLLWLTGGLGLSRTFGLLYLGAGASDALDGFLARRLEQRTELGAKLDVWADAASYPSAILLIWINPVFFAERAMLAVALFLGYVLLVTFVYLRTGEFMHSHLYSQKASAFMLTAFVVHALLFAPSPIVFNLLAIVLAVSYAETALLVTVSPRYDPDRATVFTGFASRG